MGVVGFEAVKYYENWFFGPTKVCQAFSWLFIALPNLWMASSVFCCDSLRFLTHPYTKEPKFLLPNPKNIIPAKVHVRLRISSCNMFNRFSRPLASRKSYFGPYWGLYRDQAFQWCNIGTKETAFFDIIFGPKRNFFQTKRSFLSSKHLVHSFGRLYCEFDHHLSHTVKVRSVLVKTSKTKEAKIFEVFWLKTHFFSNRNAVFIVATPFKSNWMAILWFWASWQSHSKISKRVSADKNTPKNPIFWCFCLAQNAFLSENGHFLIIGAPSTIEWAPSLRIWA